MEDPKKNEQHVLVPAEDVLILELDRRLELGTLIVEPALSVLDTAACNSVCNVQCCPVEACPDQP